MKSTLKAGKVAVLVVALSAAVAPAHGRATLLTAAEQSKLATWLGEGPITLTKVYSKAAGDTSVDFHRAADGKGRTISVMEATTSSGQTFLIGGYNPQSWTSSGAYNITPEDAQRTGFVFNLTTSAIHRQMQKAYGLELLGAYQTLNEQNSGPAWGWGNDLYVPRDLTHGGYSLLYSYADTNLANLNTSLVDGSRFTRPDLTYGALEVYTIAPAAPVPEPDSALMWLAGAAVLAAATRRRA